MDKKSAQELLDEWEAGEQTGMRPHRIKTVREDLMHYTDMWVPRRIHEIENFMATMKGQMTRKLREAAEAESGGAVVDDEDESVDSE